MYFLDSQFRVEIDDIDEEAIPASNYAVGSNAFKACRDYIASVYQLRNHIESSH
jgi:hypothetical protein